MNKTSRFNMAMAPDLHAKATAKAEKEDISLAQAVRQLLRKWLGEK